MLLFSVTEYISVYHSQFADGKYACVDFFFFFFFNFLVGTLPRVAGGLRVDDVAPEEPWSLAPPGSPHELLLCRLLKSTWCIYW